MTPELCCKKYVSNKSYYSPLAKNIFTPQSTLWKRFLYGLIISSLIKASPDHISGGWQSRQWQNKKTGAYYFGQMGKIKVPLFKLKKKPKETKAFSVELVPVLVALRNRFFFFFCSAGRLLQHAGLVGWLVGGYGFERSKAGGTGE